MKTNRTLIAAMAIATTGFLAVHSITSQAQAQEGENSRPMMQAQMQDHMAKKDTASEQGKGMDMPAMRKSMMKNMRACMSDMDKDKKMGMADKNAGAQGTMNREKMRDQMMGQMKSCMDRMSMKKGKEPAAQAGDPHQHGKKQN